MKTYKIILAIATLTLFNSVLPKVYYNIVGNMRPSTCGDIKLFGGQDLPVLDICIFLSKYFKFGGNYQSEVYASIETPAKYHDYTADQLRSAIIEQEAIIASSNLIRDNIDGHKEGGHGQCTTILNEINKPDKWLKLITKDQEFVVLIPRKKYPILGNLRRKDTISLINYIGLNPKALSVIEDIYDDQEFYNPSRDAQQQRIDKMPINAKSSGKIKLKTLLNIFGEDDTAKKINKRIYLTGHGAKQAIPSSLELPVTTTYIERRKREKQQNLKKSIVAGLVAQLLPDQYRELLDGLCKKNCSFLNVSSCYAHGWNTLTLQPEEFYTGRNTSIKQAFDNIAEKIPFITVVGSSPDIAILIGGAGGFSFDSQVSKFFTELNAFFEKQRAGYPKDVSETKILTGKGFNLRLDPLIIKKPSLADEIGKIIENIVPVSSDTPTVNLFSVRFPGLPFFRVPTESTLIFEDIYRRKIEKIDYQNLISKNIKPDSDITLKTPTVLIYPSIINCKLIVENPKTTIMSMIPVRAQHYIKKIYIGSEANKNQANFYKIFETQGQKLYFIKELFSTPKERDFLILENFALKIDGSSIEYVCKYYNGYFYKANNKLEMEISENTAKETIKKWVQETEPLQEALYEASSGIEDTNDFKKKINEIWPNLLQLKRIPGGATEDQKKNNRLAIEKLYKPKQVIKPQVPQTKPQVPQAKPQVQQVVRQQVPQARPQVPQARPQPQVQQVRQQVPQARPQPQVQQVRQQVPQARPQPQVQQVRQQVPQAKPQQIKDRAKEMEQALKEFEEKQQREQRVIVKQQAKPPVPPTKPKKTNMQLAREAFEQQRKIAQSKNKPN